MLLIGMALFLLTGPGAFARRNVKISTIGITPPRLENSLTPQQKADRMIDFLRRQLNQVLPDQPDLILLPEACDRPAGLSLKEQFEYYKVRGNQVQNFLASVAGEHDCYIAFGVKRQNESGTWRNSCVLLDRSGKVAGIYNKNFPTIPEMEGGIVASNETPIFRTDFGTIACAICFDLNFDELRKRYASLKPDIILFPSMYHGGLEQANWAYACRSYFVGSIGIAKLPSEIRNPMGRVVATTTNYFNFITATINLDYQVAHLDGNWGKLRALKNKYGPEVTIYDPGKIGSVMIISESDSVSAEEMVKEFDIELLDQYLNRSRAFRLQQGKMK
ncbi:MAG: carbon-nitrogen hydrolase family protein [Actinobacteria bacterium]|nr:carbon-nitrogen hydrolase family protein [Actinomycetota bacterium]